MDNARKHLIFALDVDSFEEAERWVKLVITSYSIHYTKLYEKGGAGYGVMFRSRIHP